MTFAALLCIPAWIYLIFTLLILIITLNLTIWNFLFLVIWVGILQGFCYAGYPFVSWVLLFVPFILSSLLF
jgi:hypothetical protein